jgi:hypothetical protein
MGVLLVAIMVTPIHPASYAPLVTIVAAHVRTPIAIIPIGTVIAVVAVAVAAVIAAVIMSAIYTPMMSAGDAIVGLRLVHGQ